MKTRALLTTGVATAALTIGLISYGSAASSKTEATASDSAENSTYETRGQRPSCKGSGIPEPTGKLGVGTTMLDEGIRVFFPAKKSAKQPRPPYLTAEEATFFDLKASPADLVIPAATDARPLHGAPRPIVLIGPGGGVPVASLTGLGTELASRGYVAVMVDANYVGEATGEGYSADDPDAPSRDRIKANLHALDLLSQPSAATKVGPVDLTRVAAGGHSAGGSIAFNLALQDTRIKAVFDLDGNLYDEANTKTVTVPALAIVAGPSRDLTYNAEIRPGPLGSVFTSNPRGVAAYIPRGAHFSVTDAPFLTDFLRDAPGAIGSNTPCVARETSTVVTRFLNTVLPAKAGQVKSPTAAKLTDGLKEIKPNP